MKAMKSEYFCQMWIESVYQCFQCSQFTVSLILIMFSFNQSIAIRYDSMIHYFSIWYNAVITMFICVIIMSHMHAQNRIALRKIFPIENILFALNLGQCLVSNVRFLKNRFWLFLCFISNPQFNSRHIWHTQRTNRNKICNSKRKRKPE